MTSAERPTLVTAIRKQLCPRCRAGKMYSGSLALGMAKMPERCEVCNLKFEREEGYFLGAMYIAYALALATILGIAILLWLATRWPLVKIATWATVLFLPFAPFLTLFARVLWIYLDQSVDPSPLE